MQRHHPLQRNIAMAHPLFQTPVLIFIGMMAAFLLTLGPIALADLIRSRRN
jgi:hypothetical protein